MADRIAVVGGELRIDTHQLQGTHVTITIPVPDTASSSMLIRTTS